jgi:hypothetical protein
MTIDAQLHQTNARALLLNSLQNSVATPLGQALSNLVHPHRAIPCPRGRWPVEVGSAAQSLRLQTVSDISGLKMSGMRKAESSASLVRWRVVALSFFPHGIVAFFRCAFLTAYVLGYDSRTLFVPKEASKKFTPFENQVPSLLLLLEFFLIPFAVLGHQVTKLRCGIVLQEGQVLRTVRLPFFHILPFIHTSAPVMKAMLM